MKCPLCNNEMVKGLVTAKDTGSLTNALTTVTWYSEAEQKKKLFKKGINLQLKAEGYYCNECMKVFASFEER